MHQFKALLRDVLDNGSWQENRTGIRTISVPGASARFDLTKGFPAVTTKKLAYKTVFGELCAFLRASDSARQFRDLGCKVWDQNANENAAWLANPYRDGPDDLGAVYGVQWRAWPAYKLIDLAHPGAGAQIADAMGRGYKQVTVVEDMTEDLGKTRSVLLYKAVDQLRACLDTIVNNPTDRRILFHAWNPAVLEELALPACHLLYQFLPNVAKRELSMCLYIRSNDLGLGCPFNTAEAAALLELVARLTGYTARWLTIFIGDAHIYESHLDMVNEQLTREPLPLPTLKISDRVPSFAETGVYAPEWLELIEPSDFSLDQYTHHGALTAPMAV